MSERFDQLVDLIEQPFTDLHSEGLAGVFPKDAERILAVIDGVNNRAETA